MSVASSGRSSGPNSRPSPLSLKLHRVVTFALAYINASATPSATLTPFRITQPPVPSSLNPSESEPYTEYGTFCISFTDQRGGELNKRARERERIRVMYIHLRRRHYPRRPRSLSSTGQPPKLLTILNIGQEAKDLEEEVDDAVHTREVSARPSRIALRGARLYSLEVKANASDHPVVNVDCGGAAATRRKNGHDQRRSKQRRRREEGQSSRRLNNVWVS